MAAAVSKSLLDSFGDAVIHSATLPDGAMIGIVIADDAHVEAITHAANHNAGALQSILITDDPATGTRADFVLPNDVDIESIMSVLRSAKEFHDQVMSLRADVARRKSAIGTIVNGQFVLRTLDEARNLATMIALACPNSDLVAVGLQELLINAVEHGNLEISAAMKQDLLLEGRWREEVEARLEDPAYIDRVVILSFQRSERIISMTIQDDGQGFDYASYISNTSPVDGYRGRGIAMARDLSFTSITYHGAGNLVEATIVLPASEAD
ncbi:ATP-binding protein [uncultured Maricaulis sp.]|uniref:ATP-binding protein n=1 Tax=uncultured Maricaulis sp. TaxID=174710 RepID=UPI00263866EE|nr:ATP-binding protein [uncultured Maricaulis sp.]